MEREISSGAMLGIVLLALAAVIALGFGVFAITKGVANEGTVGVQDSLGTVSSQVFLDYDQKVVTGTQAISGLKTFEGKPYAVLFGTTAMKSASAKIAPDHKAYPISTATARGTGVPVFLNYNAVIAGGAGGALPSTRTTGASGGDTVTTLNNLIKFENGSYFIENGLASTNGNIVFDKEIGGIYKQGNAEYVATSAKYKANLVKDRSDNIVGIALEQQ